MAEQDEGTFANGRWKILAAVVIGTFMVILDTTVINVAFPTLRAEFGAGLAVSQWIVSVYVLSLGISTPLAGFLGDRFGARRIYVLGLCIFVTGSVLAGFAPVLWALVAARALQAAGGGMATPLGAAFLFRTFPPEKQGTALGVFGVGLLVAPAVGPILGGALVSAGHWRWIFFLNVPVGLLGALWAWHVLPGRDADGARKPAVDTWGIVASVVGFGTLLYGASIAAEVGWAAPQTLVAFAVGVLGLAALLWVDLVHARDPLLEFRLYKDRTFLNASVVGYVSVLALFGAEFLLPLYLQSLRGLTAFETGLVLLPLGVAAGFTTPIAGKLYDHIGPRALVGVGFAVLALNTWQLARLDATTSLGHIRLLMGMRGVALGLTVQSTFTTALGAVDRKRVARGSSLVNGTRFVVQSIGVALLTTILAGSLSPATRALQQRAQSAGSAGQRGAGASQQSGGASGASAGAPAGGLCVAAGESRGAGGVEDRPVQRGSGLASGQTFRRACNENLAGFERAYRFTFYASLVAFALGILLPGWPGKWSGRGNLGERGGGDRGASAAGAPDEAARGTSSGESDRRPGRLAPA
jgi:DHA2 family multidrug resistance protein